MKQKSLNLKNKNKKQKQKKLKGLFNSSLILTLALIDFISDHDRCLRSSSKIGDVKGVILGCTTASDCEYREKNCKSWTSKGASCKVDCCQKDRCNGAYLVNYSALLLSVCVFIGLWLQIIIHQSKLNSCELQRKEGI